MENDSYDSKETVDEMIEEKREKEKGGWRETVT